MKISQMTKEQLFQELSKLEKCCEKYQVLPSSRKNPKFRSEMNGAYYDFIDIAKGQGKQKYAHFELSEENIKEIKTRIETLRSKYGRVTEYTEEEIENVVKAAEELCQNGKAPINGGKTYKNDKNDPKLRQQRNIGSRLKTLWTRLTPDQKKRIQEARRSVDGSYGRCTENELEERVRRLEEICAQGINPTCNFPHDSEEYRLTSFISNHMKQFTPEQIERIKAAKESAKNIKRKKRFIPVTDQDVFTAIKIIDLCESIKAESAYQICKINGPLYQKYVSMRHKYDGLCKTNKVLSGFEKTFAELIEKLNDILIQNKSASVKKQLYDFLTDVPYYFSFYLDSKMTDEERRKMLDKRNALTSVKKQYDLLDDTDKQYFDNRPTKEEYEIYKEIIEIMIKTECSRDDVHTFILKSGIEKQFWVQKYLAEEKEVMKNG